MAVSPGGVDRNEALLHCNFSPRRGATFKFTAILAPGEATHSKCRSGWADRGSRPRTRREGGRRRRWTVWAGSGNHGTRTSKPTASIGRHGRGMLFFASFSTSQLHWAVDRIPLGSTKTKTRPVAVESILHSNSPLLRANSRIDLKDRRNRDRRKVGVEESKVLTGVGAVMRKMTMQRLPIVSPVLEYL